MNSSHYTLPRSRAILQKIPEDKDDTYNQLISDHPYQVQSSVPNEIFQSFLDYWQTGTIPQINSSNILYYNSLNDEFGILENQLSLPEYQSLFDLGYLTNMDQNKNINKSSVERRIALNLESYLVDQTEILCQIPINSLYNIFYHPERNLTDYDRAYHFIIDKGSNLNEMFFILLGSLDARRFRQLENKRDAFFGREDHGGFEPQNANIFVSDIEQQLQDCRNQINQHMASNKRNQQLDADLKNANQQNQVLKTEKKIVECNYGGILHYIKSHYENLFNEIALTSSPDRREKGDVPINTILAQDDPNSYFVCLAQPNLGSWICFDFKSRKINLTDYTLRSNMIQKGNGFHPRTWFIEGSNDKLNWIQLDMQKDCVRMNDINAMNTFSIQNRSPQNFRYIRMRLTSNWAGGTELSLSLIELYGKIYF